MENLSDFVERSVTQYEVTTKENGSEGRFSNRKEAMAYAKILKQQGHKDVALHTSKFMVSVFDDELIDAYSTKTQYIK